MKVCFLKLHKKWKFSIKNFFSKCDQIHRKLRTWSHLLKKSLIENIFCAVGRLERIGNVVPVILIHKKDSKRFIKN